MFVEWQRSPRIVGIADLSALSIVMLSLALAVWVVFALPADSGPALNTMPMLIIVLAITAACVSAFSPFEKQDRPTGADLAGVVLCLLAGLLALWLVAADARGWEMSQSAHLLAVPPIVLAIVAATWRSHDRLLAIITIAAILFATIWQHTSGLSTSASGVIMHGIAEPVLLSLRDGMLGWLLQVMPSMVLPLVLLGGLLTGRRSVSAREPGKLRLFITKCTLGRLLPTLVIGTLVIFERPGFNSTLIAAAWLITICTAVVMYRRDHRATVSGLARECATFGGLLVAAAAIGLTLAVLERTALPIDVAQLLAGAAGEARWPLLILSAAVAIGLAVLMPGFAAYLLALALLAPALRATGVDAAFSQAFLLIASLAASVVALPAQAASVARAAGGAVADPSGKAASR